MPHEHPSTFPVDQPVTNPRATFMERRIRRAAAACYYCHARKVRCDAAILGYPCTNCTLDKRTDCTLRPNATSRFRKLHVKGHFPPKTVPHGANEHACDSSTETIPMAELSNKEETQPPIESNWNPEWNILPPTVNMFGDSFPDPNTSLPDFTGYFPANFLDLDRLSTLPMGEVHNISTQGCLEVPLRHVTEVFLRKYFLLVHPLLPILDEAQVWGACIQGREEPSRYRKISLFVFQAMLLASSAFVPLDVIHQCGFPDHHTARRALYNRAKVLYDTGFELDGISRAQGCVLLTFHTPVNDPEATMTWNLCAIQNAMGARVNWIASNDDPLRLTKKRLYWSLFVRDRILWLGRHRGPQFISSQFKAPLDWLRVDELEGEVGSSCVYSPDDKRLLVGIFQAQCQLAIILTDVISIAFSSYNQYSPRLSADRLTRSLLEIKELRVRLNEWKDETHSLFARQDLLQQELGSIEIITKIIWLHYQSARIALCHHETFLVEIHTDILQSAGGEILLTVAKDLKESVHQMTNVMRFFAMNNLTETIPISVLAYCGTPMILAAIDAKLSSNQSESIERGTALNYCSEVVTQSRGAYDITEFFSQGTNHLLQLAYRVTDNVFREKLGKGAQQNIASSDGVRGSHEKQPCHGLPVTPFKNLRVKGWVEAFLKYPRAYLSISACIDYSLATGHLPREEALPPLIRATLPLILGLPKLPWLISAPVQKDQETNGANLIQAEDPLPSQGEELVYPTGHSLNDPWYWTMLNNFNMDGDEVEPISIDKSSLIHSMIDLDSDDMVAASGAAINHCAAFAPNYNIPNLGIITDD